MSSWMNTTTSGAIRLGGDGGGIELPIMACTPSPLNVIIGHGLGSNPKEKNHLNDISYNLWTDAMQYLPPVPCTTTVLEQQDDDSCHYTDTHTAVFYTARGHGESRGWEHCSASDFTWPILAEDMLAVANGTMGKNSTTKSFIFTAFGQSMGAASAIYMAISHPHCTQALILARPPRAWETRRMAVNNIVESARELEERQRQASCSSGSSSLPWHLPILGAAMTDLPPKEEDKESYYAKITCPVLILCHGGDEAHPLETGSVLKTLIPQSRLHAAASNEDDARRDWPKIIADWLVEEGIVRLPPSYTMPMMLFNSA